MESGREGWRVEEEVSEKHRVGAEGERLTSEQVNLHMSLLVRHWSWEDTTDKVGTFTHMYVFATHTHNSL